eukprot:gene3548-4051_t
MPLKNIVSNSSTCQVYYCTRARRNVLKTGETRPEACILRSLSLFFFTRHLHVEDAKRVTDFSNSGKVVQVFVFHATEHNLRSQVFRSQLLEHLASNNLAVLLLRRSDFHFANMFAFFSSGCTIELKQKLKTAHERAVNVFNNCYEDAVLELVKEIKKIQLSTSKSTYLIPQSFPVVIGDAVTSFTFGMSVKDVAVESVFKVSDQKKIAVKLVKKSSSSTTPEQQQKGGQKRGEQCSRLKTFKPDRQHTTTSDVIDLSEPLAVKAIALHVRKTVFNAKRSTHHRTTENNESILLAVKDKQPSITIIPSLPELEDEYGKSSSEDHDAVSASSSSLPSASRLRPEKPEQNSTVGKDSLFHGPPRTPEKNFEAERPSTATESMKNDNSLLLQPHSIGAHKHQQCKISVRRPSKQDCCNCAFHHCSHLVNSDRNEFADEEIHETRTYAMYIPDRWGSNGEQLIYILFPEDTDKMPDYDFPLSGFSSPCSLNLSEECQSPIESPLISAPETKTTIYPQPCPVYPLESSFPPVDLPVDF